MEGKDEDNGKNKEQVDINEDDGSVYDTANGDETSSDMSEDDTTTDSSEDDDPLKEKKKKKPRRCQHPSCRTKLLLTSYACYCGQYFCALHTPPEEHKCDFDYHGMAKKKIKEDNPKVVKEKVREI